MVEKTMEDDDFGIDLASYEKEKDENLEDSFIDMESYAQEKNEKKPGFWETAGDVFTQAGRGALKAFTWPADVLKLGMIGEGLSDLDDIEEAFRKTGKPFNREDYVRSVFEAAHFIPTQDLAEKGFEELTGISLEPRTGLGKGTKQFAEIASLTPGGIAKKLASGAIGAGTTHALEKGGLGKTKAEIIGDVVSLSPAAFEKTAKVVPKSARDLEKTAQKYALPFKEFMVKEREPLLKGRLFKNAESNLKEELKLSTKEALNRIVENQIPIRRLRDKGINLDALGEHAYAETRRMAQAKPNLIKTDTIVENIDREIARIKALAPSPSDAQKSTIKLLEEERDILKVSNPSSEQLINQHMNYNSDMKSIYKKPEFSGKEEQIRKTYEFLKDELVDAMAKHGNADVSNAFKAANKIYHEKSKLVQSESILEKAFQDGYSSKKLDRILHSKQGNYLRRNLGEKAVEEIIEIAKYGKEAQEKMTKFLDLRGSSVANEVRSLGQIAPFIYFPHNIKGAALSLVKPLAKHIQGKLLTRDATRQIYKLTLKHTAEGAFNLLKKDFVQLERQIGKEWGSVDDFMDDMMGELEIYYAD